MGEEQPAGDTRGALWLSHVALGTVNPAAQGLKVRWLLYLPHARLLHDQLPLDGFGEAIFLVFWIKYQNTSLQEVGVESSGAAGEAGGVTGSPIPPPKMAALWLHRGKMAPTTRLGCGCWFSGRPVQKQ